MIQLEVKDEIVNPEDDEEESEDSSESEEISESDE
jgi:hypothetical protein